MRATTPGLALLLSLLTACGPHPTTIPAQDFSQQYAEAICQQAARCQGQASYLEQQCRDQRLAQISTQDTLKAIAAGRIAYDAAQARACIDGIQATNCEATRFSDGTVAACLAAVRGQVPAGAPCYSFFECAAGFCGGSQSVGGQCPATCPQVLGAGDECSPHFGPECDLRAGLACVGGHCIRPAASGQPCVDNSGCQSGLICVLPAGSEQPICARLHKQDEPCSSDETCQAGLYCLKGGDDASGHCTPRLPEGQPCAQSDDELSAAVRGIQCQDGLVCLGAGLTVDGGRLGGTCRKIAAQGEGCPADRQDVQFQLNGCQAGLVCPAGLCLLPPSEGLCGLHDFCLPGVATCDSTGTCVPLKDNGAPCRISPECKSGFCGDKGCADQVVFCHET